MTIISQQALQVGHFRRTDVKVGARADIIKSRDSQLIGLDRHDLAAALVDILSHQGRYVEVFYKNVVLVRRDDQVTVELAAGNRAFQILPCGDAGRSNGKYIAHAPVHSGSITIRP